VNNPCANLITTPSEGCQNPLQYVINEALLTYCNSLSQSNCEIKPVEHLINLITTECGLNDWNCVIENLDMLLDKGISTSASNICKPIYGTYIFSSVETGLKAIEAFGGSVLSCYNLRASAETFLKFNEGVGSSKTCKPSPESTTDFEICLNNFVDLSAFTLTHYNRYLEKGILEFGSNSDSNMCLIKNFILDMYNNTNIEDLDVIQTLFDKILDKGIMFFYCDGNIHIGSVETMLKVMEACG
jgi:hypothetical protein